MARFRRLLTSEFSVLKVLEPPISVLQVKGFARLDVAAKNRVESESESKACPQCFVTSETIALLSLPRNSWFICLRVFVFYVGTARNKYLQETERSLVVDFVAAEVARNPAARNSARP